MSYILDALRRADAERERGSVPGIHARPAMLGEADIEAPRSGRPGLWAGLAFVLVLLAVLGWWLLGHDSSPPTPAPPPAPAQVLAPAPVLAEPAPVSPAPALALAPVAAAPLVAAAPPAPVPPAPRAPERERPTKAKVEVAKPDKPTPGAASKPALPAANEPRVYALSELPDEIRRELPTLAVGGAMYSQNPANRMLIVNGQTFHEGDKLAPNLSLAQIRLKSAVLEYKGYRYGITY
ncbi:MAG: general secretion pathway protein GspB [Burkholderiales bacterium]